MIDDPSDDETSRPDHGGATMRDMAADPASSPAVRSQRAGSRHEPAKKPAIFPVVGIGASAGGLKSLQELFTALPADTGMAFVVISHMDSSHESLLRSLLANSTRMPVQDIRDETLVEPNRVYVIMPGTDVRLAHGALRACPRSDAMPHMPIDDFFMTLARELHNGAIGVVLSGNASDGTHGLANIKQEGGITLAETPESTTNPQMPRNAIGSGWVDKVLNPRELALELAKIARHRYVREPARPSADGEPDGLGSLDKIFSLLRQSFGVDFTHYKHGTIERRLARRMGLQNWDDLPAYTAHLREHPHELQALYQDILINVTSFFRDPATFDAIRGTILPEIMAHPSADRAIRVWVPGCSSGEEAYSIAICLLEFLGNRSDEVPIQIFATDINESALERARAGIYPRAITEDISAERLWRFFSVVEDGYKINARVRDVCVFARQNICQDLPFSKLDLISCRNVLIYFDQFLQKRILPFFHYALEPSGFLVLGSAETVGGFHDLFAIHDKQHKIYRKQWVSTPLDFASTAHESHGVGLFAKTIQKAEPTEDAMHHALERLILSRYGPNGLLVRSDMEIVQFYGNAGTLVEPASGKASLNLLKMIRQDVALEVRAMMQAARKDKQPVRRAGLAFSGDGKSRRADVEVLPLSAGGGSDDFYFVLLQEPGQVGDGSPARPDAEASIAQETPPALEGHGEVLRLQAELAIAKQYLQSTIEEQESAHEELKSATEEVLSSNEELQSTNEELETATEELQSANEELTTLNDELQSRNRLMVQGHDDLVNLLSSVNIPIVMLNNDRQIRQFTPTAERVLNLIAGDLGRPLAHINFNINLPNLEELVTEVIHTGVIKQREVRDRQGRWYSLRIRPYLTRDGKVNGAVLALLDITELKQIQERALQSERLAAIGETVTAIVHESRNALQSMQMGWSVLQSILGEQSGDVEQILRSVHEQHIVLQRQFDDLQRFAAPIHLECQPAHLGSIWKEAVESLAPLVQNRAVKILAWPAGADDACSVDVFRIQQVFRNILENSLSACADPVVIQVACRDTELHGEPAVRVSICDDGPGLTSEQRERIFDAFYTTKSRGTGLGMAICKRIVNAHAGLIEVGTLPGQGAEILITLPRRSSLSDGPPT